MLVNKEYFNTKHIYSNNALQSHVFETSLITNSAEFKICPYGI